MCPQALPNPAQCLFLRLYQRRGPWFRQPTLDYPEVGDAAAAVAQLQAAGFLATAQESDAPALVEVHPVLFGAGLVTACHVACFRRIQHINTSSRSPEFLRLPLTDAV